jgi:hypothetical protein
VRLELCQSLKLGFSYLKSGFTVIPAQAGIQIAALDSCLRGNDVTQKRRFDKALELKSEKGAVVRQEKNKIMASGGQLAARDDGQCDRIRKFAEEFPW